MSLFLNSEYNTDSNGFHAAISSTIPIANYDDDETVFLYIGVHGDPPSIDFIIIIIMPICYILWQRYRD